MNQLNFSLLPTVRVRYQLPQPSLVFVPSGIMTSQRLFLRIWAPLISAPFKLALLMLISTKRADFKIAFVRLASTSLDFTRSALLRLALLKFAPLRLALN